MKKKQLTIIIIVLLIIVTFSYQYYQNKKPSDDEFITFNEFLNDIEMDWENRTINFKSYNPGDEVKIRDEIKSIRVRPAHLIDLNLTNYMFSKVLPTNVTDTIIYFKSIWGGHNTLAFTFNIYFEGEKSQEFRPNESIDLNIKIEEYENIPYFPNINYWTGEFCEEFIRDLLINVEGDIGHSAYHYYEYNLTLGDKSQDFQQISFYDRNGYEYPLHKYVRVQLNRDNKIIDEILIFDNAYELDHSETIITLNGNNECILYEYNPETGNNTLFVMNKFNENHKYRVIFYWRITYLAPGVDTENVVGEIEFYM